jgi:menaquinone-dependent protoporphyrinogen oxidase
VGHVLVVFASVDGQARRIAERMGSVLAQCGHAVSLRSIEDGPEAIEAAGHDGLLVGAAIRYGHHSRVLEARVREKRAEIASRPNAFFSVCLSAGGPGAKPQTAQDYVSDFKRRTGWVPRRTASFAGALLYTRYNPVIRLLMRLIVGHAGGDTDTSRDYEYTDWAAVDRFAREFAASVDGDQPGALRCA